MMLAADRMVACSGTSTSYCAPFCLRNVRLARHSQPVTSHKWIHAAPSAGAMTTCRSRRAERNPSGVRDAVVSSSSPASSSASLFDPEARATERGKRFSQIVECRALYRNLVRAKFLLRLPTPVYAPPEPNESLKGEAEIKQLELEEQERRKESIEIVSEMLLTAEQLKLGLRTIPPGFGSIFSTAPSAMAAAAGVASPALSTIPEQRSAEACEEVVRKQARKYAAALRERVSSELGHLIFLSEAQALAAIEARNARYQRPSLGEGPSSVAYSPPGSPTSSSSSSSSHGNQSSLSSMGSGLTNGTDLAGKRQEAAQQLASGIEQAERVAEQFVARRIKPVLRKARETELVDLVRETGDYLRGLWVRLNGGGTRLREPPLSPDLPLPVATKLDTELAISQLSMEVDDLEARLREAVRARENKIRRARAPEGRATMPLQLKALDEEVLRLSRALAVRMLQLEMEYAGRALEDEAVDVVGSDVAELLSRQGSTAELRLLAAEFSFLDTQLAALAAQLGLEELASEGQATGQAVQGAAETPGQVVKAPAPAAVTAASAAGLASTRSPVREDGRGMVLMGSGTLDQVLATLAVEVPDLRQRTGVPDQVVFGGQGFSLTKARLQARDALDKVREAITFLSRGIKLLGSDIGNAGRLFGKAAVGGTLKPREVSAIRRTARDILTFIPFIIILIIPLSPLGHVLVFGFIQQYFPSLYPTCFTGKRQEVMIRYEELERQLLIARAQAEAAEEAAELARAAAAVARLTAPESGASGVAGAAGSLGQAAGAPMSGAVKAGGATVATTGVVWGAGRSSSANKQTAASISSMDEADEAAAVQTAQVRELEERVAAVYNDITLGDTDDEQGLPAPSSAYPAGSAVRKRLDQARKQPGGGSAAGGVEGSNSASN